MKKKQKSAQPSTAANTTTTTTDLKSLIRDHSIFFDKLVELIPAKFYLQNDDGKPWFQGLSKAAKASAKQQTKENIKKSRRDRLDPEKSQTTTLDLLKQSIEKEASIKPATNLDGENRSVTYEELRQRLHHRIEQLRGNRGNGEHSRNDKREFHQNKRKRGPELNEKSDRDGKKSDVEIEKEVTEATKEIEFGKVKIGGEEEIGMKKKRKLSRAKELESAKKLEEAKKDPEKGEVVAKKHSWKAATNRAAGIKVHDDPRLLKQSIHKGKKRHEKNVGKWKDRVDSREKMKGEKQHKRAENIAERIHQKKMRKIAKREKKLMRPGFEGRKEGYINES
uniref:Surfeit locus protein 6 n=1 Tax=Davidia involucrata TaxID=16924 RepID=A0A5B6ZCF6_DAVIN